MIRYISILVISLVTLSCESEIELDYRSTDKRVVVEAIIERLLLPNEDIDAPDKYTTTANVKLSTTRDMGALFGGYITDATLSFGDNELVEAEDSTFIFDVDYQPAIVEGENYTMSIDYNGVTYNATSSFLPKVYGGIEGLRWMSTGVSVGVTRVLFLDAYILDPGGVENFYLYNVFINGNRYSWGLGKDDANDGHPMYIPIFMRTADMADSPDEMFVKNGDTVEFRVSSIDRTTYNYLEALRSGGANPPQIFNNGALGYLLTATTTTTSIIAEIE